MQTVIPFNQSPLSPRGSGRGKVDTTISNLTAQLSNLRKAQPRSGDDDEYDDINVATPG